MTTTTADASTVATRTVALIERLGATSALGDLSSASRRALVEIGQLHNFRQGAIILSQGDPPGGIYVLLSGRVKMTRSIATGRDVILTIFEPGEVFGSVAALSSEPCHATMTAKEASQCLEIHRQDLFSLFAVKPELVEELLPLLTRHLVECRNCIVELACLRVEMRFAQLFLKLADQIGYSHNGGTLIPLALSRRELADMAGTAIETSIRTMSRWEKDGIVRKADGGFCIDDRSALEQLAEGTEV